MEYFLQPTSNFTMQQHSHSLLAAVKMHTSLFHMLVRWLSTLKLQIFRDQQLPCDLEALFVKCNWHCLNFTIKDNGTYRPDASQGVHFIHVNFVSHDCYQYFCDICLCVWLCPRRSHHCSFYIF